MVFIIDISRKKNEDGASIRTLRLSQLFNYIYGSTKIFRISNRKGHRDPLKSKKRNRFLSMFFSQDLIFIEKKSFNLLQEQIKKKKVKVVLVRFLSMFPLALALKLKNPKLKVILDADHLPSNVSLIGIKAQDFFGKLFFLKKFLLWKFIESVLPFMPFDVSFSNKDEILTWKSNYLFIPNLAQRVNFKYQGFNSNYILFCGALTSQVNLLAIKNITKNLNENIKLELLKSKLKIWIVGEKNSNLILENESHISFLGEVDYMDEYIRNAKAIILPIQSFSGTLTRVIQAAEFGVPIITTQKVMKSFSLNKNQAICIDDHEQINHFFNNTCKSSKKLLTLSRNFQDHINKNYSIEYLGKKIKNNAA